MIAPIDEKKLRERIITSIKKYEDCINFAIQEGDEKIECYYMGKQTALTELLTTINDI